MCRENTNCEWKGVLEMLKKTALIVSAALVLSLPAGVALADDDVDDSDVTVAACDYDQERAQLRDGTGVCVDGEEAVRDQQRIRQRLEATESEDCTGEGPQAGNGSGYGAGNGDGPRVAGAMNGAGRFGRAGS
jgi:hypothetical protein